MPSFRNVNFIDIVNYLKHRLSYIFNFIDMVNYLKHRLSYIFFDLKKKQLLRLNIRANFSFYFENSFNWLQI